VRRIPVILAAVFACAVALLAPLGAGAATLPSTTLPSATLLPSTTLLHRVLGECGLDLRAGFSHCNLSLLADAAGRPHAAAAPTGYGYQDLRAAYGVTSTALTNGGAQTIAIVDAYDNKTAEADLATYRSYYGLPACTTANGCFRKVNQNGVQGSYPQNNQGWALEVSLDLDMASAMCPNCHILLVEAKNNQNASLYAAVDTAVRLGATVVSNSYGGKETSADTASNVHYNHPGVAITASSGDAGYGVEYPAASPYVTSVGGTTLTSSGSGYTETVWNGAGSGCSKYQPKPSWQGDAQCATRTVADVSAVADPNTGVAVYDSNCSSLSALSGKCFKGWGQVGGTSASAPIVAAIYALAGNATSLNAAQSTYTNAAALHDVTTGSNGSCGGVYLCTAGPGYDGPTGNGTPNGIGAF
jgi:subtilase family serine protease